MEPDELIWTASTLTFDPVRRAALDKLNTYFLGPITAEEAEHLNKTLYIFASERRLQFQETGQIDTSPFTIFIDSPGGEVDAGLAIMNMVLPGPAGLWLPGAHGRPRHGLQHGRDPRRPERLSPHHGALRHHARPRAVVDPGRQGRSHLPRL